MKRFQVLLIAIAIFNLAINPLFVAAQSPQGVLVGRVTDNQGASLPGVTVTATSPSLQGSRTATTDSNGLFVMSGLPPGQYKLTFELEGFATVVKNIDINLGSNSIDVTMQIAEVVEEIIVTGQQETITETSTISATTTYSPNEIENLPISRALEEAVNLAPGIVTDIDYNARSKSFGAPTILGAFTFDNLFLVNGVEINENIRGQELPLFIEDAVYETTTAIAGISAEYGRFTGGVINVITKSGGNDLSGSFTVDVEEDWHYRSNDTNAGRTPNVKDMAYGNSFTDKEPPMYIIDSNNDTLAMADDPSSGALKTIAKFPFARYTAGFDIAPNGKAFAAFTFPGQDFSWLYKVDLTTGDCNKIGRIGGGDMGPVDFLTVVGGANPVQCSVDKINSYGPLDGSHNFTATITSGGEPAPPGIPISVEITDGPNKGLAGTGQTKDNGQVEVSYQNKNGQKGADIIVVRGSFLGQEFTCTVRQIWTDLPVITDAKIKSTLNKVILKGFNFFGWNLEATINGQTVKFKVKSDTKAVAKKTRNAIGNCDGAQTIEIFSDGFESGDTSSWTTTCP